MKPKRKQLVLWSGGALLAALLVAGGLVFFTHRSAGQLPAVVTKNAGFAVYYPSPMVPGYSLQKGSAKLDNGFVFYALANGTDKITVSEQAAPPTPPDLTHLIGFTSLNMLAGNAASGTNSSKQPTVIIASNTTLITLTGQRGLPSDIVAQAAQSMRSLPQQ